MQLRTNRRKVVRFTEQYPEFDVFSLECEIHVAETELQECLLCQQRVRRKEHHVRCWNCLGRVHTNCISAVYGDHYKMEDDTFICVPCEQERRMPKVPIKQDSRNSSVDIGTHAMS